MSNAYIDNVAYNSAYVSLNLLDELDYFLGGYGKPNVEFIFSLNTFIETFIACSHFYTSLDELNHLNLTAPAIFPNGRPILNLLVREGGLKFVNGVLDKPGKVIYQSEINENRRKTQQDFILKFGSKFYQNYFIHSDIGHIVEKIPLITSTFLDDQYVVSEVQTTSAELISNLINVSNTTSIQTTLPVYLFNEQISALDKAPYSIQSLKEIAKLHNVNIEDLQKSLGYRYLPIPPFTNILLSQVNSIYDIPQKLSQLRADFQDLRQKFIDLEMEIFETESIKKQLDAHKKFNEFWSVFNRKYVHKTNRIFYGHLDIGAGVDIDKSADAFMETGNFSEAIKDMNFGKMIGNIVSKVYNWNSDRRIINRYKGLTNIWELFQNSKNLTQQLNHCEKIFDVKFSNSNLLGVHNFVNQKIKNITEIIKQ